MTATDFDAIMGEKFGGDIAEECGYHRKYWRDCVNKGREIMPERLTCMLDAAEARAKQTLAAVKAARKEAKP